MKISYPAAVRSVVPRWRNASAARTSRTASTASSASAWWAGSGDSSHAYASPAGSPYQRAFALSRARQVVAEIQVGPARADDPRARRRRPAANPAKARGIGVQSGGHGRLAVTHGERGELAHDDVVRDAERCDGADRGDANRDRAAARPELVDDVVHRARERDLRRIAARAPGGLPASDRACRRRGCRRAGLRARARTPAGARAAPAAADLQPCRRGRATPAATSRAWTTP